MDNATPLAQLFASVDRGDPQAGSALFAALYSELHRLASASSLARAGGCRSAPPACSTRRISTSRGATAPRSPTARGSWPTRRGSCAGSSSTTPATARRKSAAEQFELTALSTDALEAGVGGRGELDRIERRARRTGRRRAGSGRGRGPQVLLRLLVRGDRGDEGPVGAHGAPVLDQGAGLPARALSETPRSCDANDPHAQQSPGELADRKSLPRDRARSWRQKRAPAGSPPFARRRRSWRTRIDQWLAHLRRARAGRISSKASAEVEPARVGPGGPAARRLPPGRAPRPRRHGQRVAGRAHRRPLRGARRRQAAERRPCRPRRRGALRARRAASSRGWRIRTSRTCSTPASSPIGQPYLVLEHVDGEPIDRYCDAPAPGRRRPSCGSSSTCSRRSRTRTRTSSSTATSSRPTCW